MGLLNTLTQIGSYIPSPVQPFFMAANAASNLANKNYAGAIGAGAGLLGTAGVINSDTASQWTKAAQQVGGTKTNTQVNPNTNTGTMSTNNWTTSFSNSKKKKQDKWDQ